MNTAHVAFMITNGYTQDQINAMTPTAAHTILAEFDAPDFTPQDAQPTPKQSRQAILLAAALAYAAQGLAIMPLHEPLFDSDGKLTGCSCETWKRSKKYFEWLRAKGLEKKFDPDYTCRTPGKHPRLADWESNASNERQQISTWWHKWPTANIGLAVGKSGLVTFDLDSYKDVFGDDGDLFTLADKQTVTQLSGGGGEHLVYAMPAGKAYTNANNTLPPGIDIRGVGGMQVLAPSLHPSGRQYAWEDGYSILERAPSPLPAALQAILDAAQQNSAPAKAITFTVVTTERPALIRWAFSKKTRDLINTPGIVGQRSENDMTVCVALVYAGATDDDILAVFQHYPIGTAGKYAQAGDVYLAHTIGKARGYAEAHPRPDVGATIDNLLLWARTHSFATMIKPDFLASDGTYRTDATDTRIADAILCEMKDKHRLTVNIGKKRLAKLAGVTCNTAGSAVARLSGWLFDVVEDAQYGAQITVDPCRLHYIDPSLVGSLVGSPVTYRDQSSANEQHLIEINEYSPHKTEEPFLSGTSKVMRTRILDIAQALDLSHAQAKNEYTFAALGEAGLRVIDAIARCGELTIGDLSDETGKKPSAIRNAMHKLVQHGIIEAERPNATTAYVYHLPLDYWQRIDAIAPNLRTYTTSSQRESKRLEAAQQWAQQGMATAQDDQAQRLERRFAKLAHERVPHLARLHPDLTPADIERIAYEVSAYKKGAHPATIAKLARLHGEARMDLAESRHAEQWETSRLLTENIEQLKANNTPKHQWYAMLTIAGFTPNEAKRAIGGAL